MISFRTVCCMLALGAGLAGTANAAKAPPARILLVVSTSEVSTVASRGLNNLNGRQMNKFLDQIERVQENIKVSWEAPEGGWSGRTEVKLEYRTQESDEIRGAIQRYEETKSGRHVTTFYVPPGEVLSAWRVRLVQDGRMQGEKSSGSWK